jgi:hypothetical protein
MSVHCYWVNELGSRNFQITIIFYNGPGPKAMMAAIRVMIGVAGMTNGRTSVRPFVNIKIAML